MVAPIVIGGVTLGIAAVGYFGGKWFGQTENGLVELAEDAAQEAIEGGAILVESFADLIGDLGESIAEGTLGVIRGAGVAVLDASQATYTYIQGKISDRRVETVAVLWAMLLYGLTFATIYKKIRDA